MSFDAILRRRIDSRLRPSRRLRLVAPAAVATLVMAASAAAAGPTWRAQTPLPLARTEVAAARSGAEIVVVGGYLASGETTARVDAYSPSANRWRRQPDLPVAVNHAMAATWRGRAIVAGGYGGPRRPLRTAFELVGGRWRPLPPLPSPRAAAGAAVVGDTLYVMGGVGPAGLARSALALDLKRKRWRTIGGPTPREHLAVTSAGGRVYVLAGRTAGLDTNLRLLERYDPRTRRWRRLRPVPESRGGTGAAVAAGLLVSVGGEAPSGTIASVYGYDLRTGRWRRLPDLPTPRHGLGVVAVGSRVYALAGGPQPGLHVSAANEVLHVG